MTTQELENMGYTVKHAPVGWWVDGRCGYSVAGYYTTEQKAVDAAWTNIQEVHAKRYHPSWLYREEELQ